MRTINVFADQEKVVHAIPTVHYYILWWIVKDDIREIHLFLRRDVYSSSG